MDVLVHVEEDTGASEGNTEGEEHEPERLPDPRCGKAIQDGKEPGGCEGRDAMELSLDGGVVETFDNTGKEVGEAVAN